MMEIKDITKGTIFSESAYGMTLTLTAVEDAQRVEGREGSADGWEVHGALVGGRGQPVRFFASDHDPAYAPQLTLVKKG